MVTLSPHVAGNQRIAYFPGKVFSDSEINALKAARAIVAPQSTSAALWDFLQGFSKPVFPDYTHRYGFEGKAGNLALFEKFSIPHPQTRAFDGARVFWDAGLPFGFPVVLKADRGGCGNAVFCATNPQSLKSALARIGNRRFVVQEYINHQGQDLRVVVMGNDFYPYWRTQPNRAEFRNNVGKGARIDKDILPEFTGLGVQCVQDLCQKTGINLAAVDVLFDRAAPCPAPLVCEINFCFGRKGMGGSARFYEMLDKAVHRWLNEFS